MTSTSDKSYIIFASVGNGVSCIPSRFEDFLGQKTNHGRNFNIYSVVEWLPHLNVLATSFIESKGLLAATC